MAEGEGAEFYKFWCFGWFIACSNKGNKKRRWN